MPIDYLNPNLPSGLPVVAMPIVDATPETLEGYGHLVSDPAESPLETPSLLAVRTVPVTKTVPFGAFRVMLNWPAPLSPDRSVPEMRMSPLVDS